MIIDSLYHKYIELIQCDGDILFLRIKIKIIEPKF